MNVETDEFQGQRSPVRIFYSVQTLLIVRIIIEAVRGRLNRPVSRDDRSLAALREADAKSPSGIAEARFEVQIQVATGGHDHCRIVLRFSRETRDRSTHR